MIILTQKELKFLLNMLNITAIEAGFKNNDRDDYVTNLINMNIVKDDQLSKSGEKIFNIVLGKIEKSILKKEYV